MFKMIGSVFIVICTTFLASKSIIQSFVTYTYIKKSIDIINKICFEKNSNAIYDKIYKKIGFNKREYLNDLQQSIYINGDIQQKIIEFFNDIGKKDRLAEDEYIQFFLKEMEQEKNYYYKKYIDNRKLYILYGISIGTFLIIILL